MRIVAFGTYQADSHPRVAVLIEGLRAHGHEVVELNEPLGLSTADRVGMLQRPWRLPVLAGRLASRWYRLWRRGRAQLRTARPDAVLVGYLGHFDVQLAALTFRGIPVVLDHLIFAAGTAIDRGTRQGLRTRLLSVLDRRALAAADVVVLDTEEHRRQVPPDLQDRAVVCPVGADARWFAAGRSAAPDPAPGEPVRVAFFGLYTPLQGATVIGAALGRLAGRDDLQVTMIGAGQDLAATRGAAGPDAPVVWRDLVPAAELPALIAGQHVALGIFGTSAKALHVVPNKVFQSAAAGNAVVTSDTGPQRRLLADDALFVPPGDAGALAAALVRLTEDRAELARLRAAATRRAESFTAAAVVEPLLHKLAR
ncbi:glycosyltransferase [Nakamurella endophytica]|uniref:Glycosyltransferase subfamily 4-like N-terminal domain-containing protein n=1 Tax=Nakamurella endophytica TaxID=1748367 RepID=A0A917SKU6_9ACTN|nr:glycosyltransferase [Nakamurella endophytica]GGL87031.1 hypothetical protein GCM10011594_03280 [Nakamurella endophytica]